MKVLIIDGSPREKGNTYIAISEMLKESDVNMYAEKAKYYSDIRRDRRRR